MSREAGYASSGEAEDDYDDDLWDAFATCWEAEFERISKAEEERLSKVNEQVKILANRNSEAYRSVVETAVKQGDEHAHRASARAAAIDDRYHKQAVDQVKDDAELRRIEVTKSALQGSDDLYQDILEGRAARKEEREAKRKEERRARQAEMEARRKQRNAQGEAPKADAKPPPRFTRKPGEGAAASQASKAPAAPLAGATKEKGASTGWDDFEQRLVQGGSLQLADVPWPEEAPATVSGVAESDSAEQRKLKLRKAVLRWHPDKWGPALPRFSEADQPVLLERVKAITRRILEERQRFCSRAK
mmetsp:Transcript_17317/g.30373  ORF Transcript_17317/g.30373 Transcript_17317/m.30373 type:complete len:304 (-) Transcript_17317:267-1178(-)